MANKTLIKNQLKELINDSITLASSSRDQLVKAKALLLDSMTESEKAKALVDFLEDDLPEQPVGITPTPSVSPQVTVTPTPTSSGTPVNTVTPTPTNSGVPVTPTPSSTNGYVPFPTPDFSLLGWQYQPIPVNQLPVLEEPIYKADKDFANLPYLNFAILFGRDTTAFKKMLAEVGTKTEHFYLKGNFEIAEELTLPANIKFSFDFDAQITFKKDVQWYSRIDADDYSYIFKIDGGQPQLWSGACRSISFAWFGANVTNEDNSSFFQKAVDCGNFIGDFTIPAVNHQNPNPYKIGKTVNFVSWNKPNAVVFPTWIVRGYGTSDNADGRQRSSKLLYTAKSGPCINFRGARQLTKAVNFEIEGLNTKPAQIKNLGLNNIDWWNEENWISDGISLDRYDHHCGIAFDWVEEGDSKPWSAQSLIYGVKISGFAVSISISPQESMQGDTVDVYKTKLINCAYGISIGQDQIRACTFRDVWMDMMHTFYTNRRFGRRNGSTFNITGGQYTTALRCFHVGAATAGNSYIDGAYFEAIGIIGLIDSWGNNTHGVVFRGCDFLMNNHGYLKDDQWAWTTPYGTCYGGANITFIGGTFRSDKNYLAFFSGANGRINFEGVGMGTIDQIFIDGFSASNRHERLNFRNCTWYDTTVNLNEVPSINQFEKKYVRYHTDMYREYLGDGSPSSTGVVTRVLTEPFLLQDMVANNALTEDQPKVFTHKMGTGEAKFFKKGDYVSGLCKLGTFSGIDLSFWQLDPPCLRVVEVKGDEITYEKLGPEVDLSLSNNAWGKPYTFNKCWIKTNPTLANVSEGDWFRNNGKTNRIIDGKPVVQVNDGDVIRGR